MKGENSSKWNDICNVDITLNRGNKYSKISNHKMESKNNKNYRNTILILLFLIVMAINVPMVFAGVQDIKKLPRQIFVQCPQGCECMTEAEAKGTANEALYDY